MVVKYRLGRDNLRIRRITGILNLSRKINWCLASYSFQSVNLYDSLVIANFIILNDDQMNDSDHEIPIHATLIT